MEKHVGKTRKHNAKPTTSKGKKKASLPNASSQVPGKTGGVIPAHKVAPLLLSLRAAKLAHKLSAPMRGMSGPSSLGRWLKEEWIRPQIQHKYVDASNLYLASGVAGVLGIVYFSANDMFDPNRSGTGHQPLGFDQLMLYYNHFIVLKSHIRVKFATQEITAAYAGPMHVGITLADTNSLGTGLNQVMEQPFTTSTQLTLTQTKGKGFVELEARFDARTWYNVDNPRDALATLAGSSGASPSDEVFYCIWVCDHNAADSTRDVALTVELDLLTEYYEPQELASS